MEILLFEINTYLMMVKNHKNTCNTCKHYGFLIDGHEYTLASHARAKGSRLKLGFEG